jgi:NADP-dependent 3-hydroxy acid dehydrogenase YdfG
MYRNALITGASSGLGHGLAQFFAKKGVKVWGAARRIDSMPEGVTPIALDVADADKTIETIRKLDDDVGGLDLIIANAGTGPATPADNVDWGLLNQMIDVNVRGAAATLVAISDRMAQRGAGHLVGVSSLAGSRGAPRYAGYSASKAFLTTFLEGLRLDLAPRGVKVTTIRPSYVKTPGTAKNSFKMPLILELDDAVRIRCRVPVTVGDDDGPRPDSPERRVGLRRASLRTEGLTLLSVRSLS